MVPPSCHEFTRVVAALRPAPVRLVRLAPRIRPQSRLELALCAAFRCQPVWSLTALVARLALAPADSAPGLATQTGSLPSADALLGRDAARRALEIWLAQGLLAEVAPADPAPVLITSRNEAPEPGMHLPAEEMQRRAVSLPRAP